MDYQTLFDVAAGAALALSGWFGRSLWEANKELREDLARLREEIPKVYVAKEDYRLDLHEIKELLKSISDKLDRKADK